MRIHLCFSQRWPSIHTKTTFPAIQSSLVSDYHVKKPTEAYFQLMIKQVVNKETV